MNPIVLLIGGGISMLLGLAGEEPAHMAVGMGLIWMGMAGIIERKK